MARRAGTPSGAVRPVRQGGQAAAVLQDWLALTEGMADVRTLIVDYLSDVPELRGLAARW